MIYINKTTKYFIQNGVPTEAIIAAEKNHTTPYAYKNA